MKNFLLTLLIFAMFTPGLACAQFMQPHKTHMSMAGTMRDMPCCPKPAQKECPGGMFFKDCMKIDLQHTTDAPLVKKTDIVKIVPYILPQDVMVHSFGILQASLIRGPPDPPEIASLSSLPIFLTTQRLRI